LAGLGVDELARQRVRGRAAGAWPVVEAGGTVVLIAMQPQAHDVLAAGLERGELGHGGAAIGQQHPVDTQGDAADGLPAELLQVVALGIGQVDEEHGEHLRPARRARIVPNLWSHA